MQLLPMTSHCAPVDMPRQLPPFPPVVKLSSHTLLINSEFAETVIPLLPMPAPDPEFSLQMQSRIRLPACARIPMPPPFTPVFWELWQFLIMAWILAAIPTPSPFGSAVLLTWQFSAL